MPPVPKPTFKRRVPKRKNVTNFSEKTIQEILDRDNHQCIRCGSYHLENRPHHVIYRSGMGTGHKRNGVAICPHCHEWAHASKKKNNTWFVEWVELNLDEDGNLIHDVPVMPG